MGTPGNQTAQYFLADPQEPQPISVEVPSPYREGRIVLADFCADLPGTRGKISAHFATSGLGESLGDVLVLRGAGRQFKERIDADPDLRRLLPEGHPVLCLYGNGDAERRPQLESPRWAAAPEPEPTLEDLRAIELHGLLEARGGILQGPEAHYELPGGAHVETYVRLRNALEAQHDCRRMIDWLLPELTNGCQILIAHRGLGAFQIALEARLRELFDWEVEIHCLPRYDQSQGRDSHVPVSMEPDESRRQVVVIGVDTRAREGRGIGAREQRLNGSGYATASKVCLVDTTHPLAASDAFLHLPVEKCVEDDCERCKESEPALASIDPDEETLTPTGKREQLKVTQPDVEEDKDFWQIVERAGAARVHVDQRYEAPNKPGAKRHRPFDLDVGRLLGDEEFRGECIVKLGHLRAYDGDCVVLIPDHERAEELRRLAEVALELPPAAVHVVPRLDPTRGLDAADLERNRLIILDDMLWTGATVIGMVSKLKNRLSPERFSQIDVRAFVVLNCAATEDRVRGVISNLTPGSGRSKRLLQHCRRVPLPREKELCPWCSEVKWLEGSLKERLQALHPAYLESRLKVLKEAPAASLSPLADAETLIDTFLGDISSETALVRWASALQGKRAKHRKPGEPQPPGYYVDASFIAMRWKDWAQCAGILRVASEGEVRYALQEESFEEQWAIKAPDMKLSTLAEFGWAAIEGKLTAPSAELVRQTLEENRGKDPALAAFADLLRVEEPAPAAQAA